MSREENSSAKATPFNGKTILVVEDDQEIGHMIVLTLSQETPYQAHLVQNGSDALHLVQSMIPILFLLDYHLPGITGIQLYDQLHTIKELEAIPAIIISANLPLYELKKRQIVGLRKPFDIDKLLSTIERILAY